MKGFLSMQVNPKFYPKQELMGRAGVELAALAPNIAIRLRHRIGIARWKK